MRLGTLSSRRAALARTALAALGAAFVATACGGAGDRPNILLYVSDTLRADSLGCYGNETVATPNFDRFAAEGTVFERAIAPSSWTRASMGSILTGTEPAVHGAEKRYDLLEDSVVLISELLANEGYATANITTNRNVGSFFGFDQGWSDGGFIELYEKRESEMVHVHELTTRAGAVTKRAIEWLETAPEPWFIVVHTIDPHSPYTPPKKWDRYGRGINSKADGTQQSLAELSKKKDGTVTRTPEDEARILSLYYGEISYNDNAFGDLVDWLRRAGHYEDLITVFTSDHGEEFWELFERGHGKTVNEKSLHVPLVVRAPGRVTRGQRVDSIVSTTDILPTIFDLADLTVPYWVEGTSVFEPQSEDDILFSSCLLSKKELYVARTPRWKFVWDAKNDRKRLYDMSETEIEGDNVIQDHRDVGAELYQAVTAELKRRRERRTEMHGAPFARVVGESADELPDDVREDLEAHGYLGDDPAESDE